MVSFWSLIAFVVAVQSKVSERATSGAYMGDAAFSMDADAPDPVDSGVCAFETFCGEVGHTSRGVVEGCYCAQPAWLGAMQRG